MATLFGSWGGPPTFPFIALETWGPQDCITTPHTAGPGETAIVSSNITAYFTEASQRQFIAAFTVDGVQDFVPSNGMAAVTDVANVSVHGRVALQAGKEYRFLPLIRADFVDATLDWVQCTTLVQVVRTP